MMVMVMVTDASRRGAHLVLRFAFSVIRGIAHGAVADGLRAGDGPANRTSMTCEAACYTVRNHAMPTRTNIECWVKAYVALSIGAVAAETFGRVVLCVFILACFALRCEGRS